MDIECAKKGLLEFIAGQRRKNIASRLKCIAIHFNKSYGSTLDPRGELKACGVDNEDLQVVADASCGRVLRHFAHCLGSPRQKKVQKGGRLKHQMPCFNLGTQSPTHDETQVEMPQNLFVVFQHNESVPAPKLVNKTQDFLHPSDNVVTDDYWALS